MLKSIYKSEEERILFLECRGMNFANDDVLNPGNYRICTDENVAGEDGRSYFLEFRKCDHNIYRNTNKRTGKPLKHSVMECINKNGLYINTEYKNEAGGSWRNPKLEQTIWNENLSFNIGDILEAVNYISCFTYNTVVLFEKVLTGSASYIYDDILGYVNKLSGYREKEILKHLTFVKEKKDGEHNLFYFYNVTGDYFVFDYTTKSIVG